MDSVFIRVNNKEFGPLSATELKELITNGSFSKDDSIWDEESGEWMTASDTVMFNSLFLPRTGKIRRKNKIYAVASGKGGVGKTVLTSSIGVGLASMGEDVILVDADFGGANLHTCMGILEPRFTFYDFYTLNKENVEDILLETPVENLKLISGACGTLGLANQKYYQKQRLIRQLKKLNTDSVILDLGAGSSYDIIDFFLLADEKLLVVSPEPTSVYEAFGFIKVSLLRALTRVMRSFPDALRIVEKHAVNLPSMSHQTIGDLAEAVEKLDSEAGSIFKKVLDSFQIKLILNMVKSSEDLKEAKAIQAAAIELLSVHVESLGYISYDEKVQRSVKAMKPFLLHSPKCRASKELTSLIRTKFLGKEGIKDFLEKRRWRKQFENFSKKYPDFDFLVDAATCSHKCIYWGDCEYQDGGNPCRVRHLERNFRETITSNQVTK